MKIIDKSFFKFLLVGVLNTGVSFILMFLLEGLGYWPSTAIAYVAGAVISFFLNKHFTFKSKQNVWKEALKFALMVAVCYVVAYSLAKPLMEWALSFTSFSDIWTERITKIFAMGLYTLINYITQKFITFTNKK